MSIAGARQKIVLITGASGYVGRPTFEAAVRAGYDVIGTYCHQPPALSGGRLARLDLRDAAAVSALVADVRPDAIIHAAAAWATPEEAQAVIVGGTAAVARAASAVGSRLIHLSSDVVFDGEHAPYREADPPAPITFYARAKAAAEFVVGAEIADHVIVRTSLVTCFDPPDPRTEAILRGCTASAPAGRAPLGSGDAAVPPRTFTLFTDEHRCPVRTEDLAAALVELISHPHRGVLHVAGPERMSRYALGLRVAAYWGLQPNGILAGASAGSGLVRPRDCTLDISLAQRILRTPLRPLPGIVQPA